ncbi:hypothetical protein QFC22_005935 [Naganishia vaughanmartiniae]|uniref:Uncharacterized protein n=1 Tax=Naganishia vaughanmartiniae TaxID=1424756 RepID=A0ACC2WSW4_9TREE|nr:hypothetical protein QFC22_005935 [Naganishia vaughanmartiniae]
MDTGHVPPATAGDQSLNKNSTKVSIGDGSDKGSGDDGRIVGPSELKRSPLLTARNNSPQPPLSPTSDDLAFRNASSLFTRSKPSSPTNIASSPFATPRSESPLHLSPSKLIRMSSNPFPVPANAPPLRRGQSYVTSGTNSVTSSSLASGNGHMTVGASEPADIRRPRSNSHSSVGDNAKPVFSTRPNLGGRAASSATGMNNRSSTSSNTSTFNTPQQIEMPDTNADAKLPSNPFAIGNYSMSPALRLTPSPDSEHDSTELSPDADDEASPESPSVSAPPVSSRIMRSSPSPSEYVNAEGYRQSEAVAGNTISNFGLPEAQAAANVSLPAAATGDTMYTLHDVTGGVVTNPDVEGIPEALSMPKDLMPNEDAFEEEGLTTLERIFLLSRSEHAFHRSYIARMMGELLEDVDPCESVEYVLPLLNGFAMDEDESVKEAFASQLHRVLWYYFTTCDLIGEDDGSPLVEFPPVSKVITITSEGVKTLPRTNTFTGEIFPMVASASNDSVLEVEDMPSSGLSTDSDPSPADAESLSHRKESHASTQSSSLTQTVGTPTSMVETPSSIESIKTGSELSSTVGVRDALPDETKEKVLPSIPASRDEREQQQDDGDEDRVNVERPQIPVHMFTALIGSMLLSPNPGVADPVRAAIVAILAKLRFADTPLLDEWEDVRPRTTVNVYHGQFGEHIHLSNKFTGTARKMVQNEIMHGIIIGMGRLDAELPESMRRRGSGKQSLEGGEGSDVGSNAGTAARSSRPGLGRTVSRSSAHSIDSPSLADSQSTEMMAYKEQLQQEALMGRAISMNLIASIAEFVNVDDIVRYGLLDEVLHTAEDDPCVKMEGALALAFLAKSAPLHTLDSMLGLFENYVMDQNEQVRQSACLCLPALCKRISNIEDRRSYATRAFDTLLNSGDLVQYTALEIIGEIVHLFYDDPLGPPQELLDVYLNQSKLIREKGLTSDPEDDVVRQFNDPDRAVVSAFNRRRQLPAICLALGSNRWPEIRPTFKALCNITHQRITVSLAAAIHEIAKIIGPDLASQDLLLPFFEWLNGNDEIRGRVLAELPKFLAQLPAADAADTLQSILAMWETGEFRNWRHRETLAGHAPAILEVLSVTDHGELALDLLKAGLFDTFQVIRDSAINAVPSCLKIVKGQDALYDRIFDILAELANHEKFKHRKTYIACVQAFVNAGIGRTFFEKHLLEWLPAMSDDLLDVKIALAKLIGNICAPINKGGLYPHAPLRPLRLSEAIERLMHEPSEYVRKPLMEVQSYRPRLTHSERGSQVSTYLSSSQESRSSGAGTPAQDVTPPAGRRSSSASMLLRVDSDSTIMPDTRATFDDLSRDDLLSAGPTSAPVAMMSAPFSSPGSNGTQTPGSQTRPSRRRSLSEYWQAGQPVTSRKHADLSNALVEPVQVGMNDIFSATFAKAVEELELDKTR